jgi:hypothetical protein
MALSPTPQQFWLCGATWAWIVAAIALTGISAASHLRNTETRTIEPHRSYSRSIKRGESHHYELPLLSNQYARIEAKEFEIDVTLTVLGPHHERLAETDGEGCGSALVSFVAPADATFEIVVRAKPDSTDLGRYDLRELVVRPSRPDDEEEIEAQVLFHDAMQRRSGSKDEVEKAIDLAGKAAALWEKTADRLPSGQAHTLDGVLRSLPTIE